jgi:hypothetical protein
MYSIGLRCVTDIDVYINQAGKEELDANKLVNEIRHFSKLLCSQAKIVYF